MKRLLVLSAFAALTSCGGANNQPAGDPSKAAVHMTTTPVDNRLGKFWIRLAVKNLEASRAFYQKLGFEVVTGDGKTWQVVKNGDVTLSLIEGKFERSILTFNPGRDSQRERPSSFVDLRELHARAKAAGLVPSDETGLDGAGSGSFMLTDPDGNPVLFDRHE